jgi:uncharacterized Fe-S cluster-containing protein
VWDSNDQEDGSQARLSGEVEATMSYLLVVTLWAGARTEVVSRHDTETACRTAMYVEVLTSARGMSARYRCVETE